MHGQVSTNKTFKIPQVPMAVLANDTISDLPVMCKGNGWALKEFCLYTSYMFTFAMTERQLKMLFKSYLSIILAHKGGNVGILSDNSKEFKNEILNEACGELGIKRLFCKPFHAQGNATVENVLKILKQCYVRQWSLLCYLPFLFV